MKIVMGHRRKRTGLTPGEAAANDKLGENLKPTQLSNETVEIGLAIRDMQFLCYSQADIDDEVARIRERYARMKAKQ